MRAIKCSSCGANDFRTENGFMVCNYCGSKFIIDESNRVATHHKDSLRNDIEINRTVTQKNTSLRSDVEQLLAKCKANPRRARKYAILVLEMDPTNKEALKYL